MRRVSFGPLLAVALTTLCPLGCVFNAKVPTESFISCRNDSECPNTSRCSATLQRCVPAVASSELPPELDNAALVIEPPIARKGAVVSVRLRTQSPLARAPQISVGGVAAMTLQSESDGEYRFSYEVTGEEPEGELRLTADLIDRQGTQSRAVNVGSVVLDFTPPSATFLLDQAAPASLFKAEDSVLLVEVTPDETLASLSLRINQSELTTTDGTHFSHTVRLQDGEGAHDLVATLTDLAGNSTQLVVPGELTFDFTAPGLASPAELSQSAMRAGQTLTLVTTFSEELLAEPPVYAHRVGAPDTERIECTRVSQVGTRFTYALRLQSEAEGTYELQMGSGMDRAGNVIAPRTLGEVEFDRTAPALTSLALSRDRLSRVSGFDSLTLTVQSSEPIASLQDVDVRLAGQRLTTCQLVSEQEISCSYQVDGAASEGAASAVVTIADSAGNLGFTSAGLTFDFTPPTLAHSSVTPAQGKLGDTLLLSILASEPLRVVPEPQTAGVAWTHLVGTNFAYSHSVVATDAEQQLAPLVVLEDSVGNQSAPLSTAEVSIDATTPTITSITMVNGTLFSRVSNHNEIVADVAFDEDIPAGGGGGVSMLLGSGDYGSCFETNPRLYRCSYTVAPALGPNEGVDALLFQVSDAAGNRVTANRVVTFDYTPPSLVGTPRLSRNDGNSRASISTNEIFINGSRIDEQASRPTLRIDLALSEAVLGQPSVSLSPTSQSQTGLAYAFDYIDSSNSDRDETVTVTATDLAGNQSANLTVGTIHFDYTRPAAPHPVTSARLERRPTGDSLSAAPRTTLVPLQSIEPEASFLVWTNADPNQSSLLAQRHADSAGALSPITLPSGDRASVFVQIRDRAGNLSADTAQELKTGRWYAGLANGNGPHQVVKTEASEDVALSTLYGEQGANAVALTLTDGATETISNLANYSAWWIDPTGAPPVRSGAAFAYDPSTRDLVMYGGARRDFEAGPNDVEFMKDLWRYDGRAWKPVAPTATPDDQIYANLLFLNAVDPNKAKLILIGGSHCYTSHNSPCDQIHSLDGDTFRREDTRMAGWPAPRPTMRMYPLTVADPQNHRILYFGGVCGNNPCSDLWSFQEDPDGPGDYQWVELVPSGGMNPNMMGDGYRDSAVVDEARNQLVFITPGAYDGNNYKTEVWELDLGTLASTLKCDGDCPYPFYSSLIQMPLSYDSTQQRVLMHGMLEYGFSSDHRLQRESFTWDGSTFKPLKCNSWYLDNAPDCINLQYPQTEWRFSRLYQIEVRAPVFVNDPARHHTSYWIPYSDYEWRPEVLKHPPHMKPAFTAQFDLTTFGLPRTVVSALTVNAVASGEAFDPLGTAQPGVSLSLLSQTLGRFQTQANNTATGLASLSCSLTNSSTLGQWVSASSVLTARVEPLGPAFSYDLDATVAVDAFELSIDYQLP